MIYVDADGHQKHVKDENAKLVEREKRGAHVGKTMRCVAGTHAGLLCEVLALEPKVSTTSLCEIAPLLSHISLCLPTCCAHLSLEHRARLANGANVQFVSCRC
jgi:hypothetical protein